MNDAHERVILVDAKDRPVGTAPKLDVHRSGELHRAFSILVHDGAGRFLLQKRNKGKYHSGGLWTNTCCGHPRPGEDIGAAATRRLGEEMGFSCPLVERRHLIYRAEVGSGLTEHEFVHLFVGSWSGDVSPAPDEAEAHDWRSFEALSSDLAASPHRFTAWFPLYLGDLERMTAMG